QHGKADVGLGALEPATREASQGAVLFDVGEAKFHGLLAPPVELFGFLGGHSRAVRIHKRFMFAPFDAASAIGVGGATLFQRTGAAMFRGTKITVHDVDFAIGLGTLLLTDPAQTMSLRTNVNLFIRLPCELLLAEELFPVAVFFNLGLVLIILL